MSISLGYSGSAQVSDLQQFTVQRNESGDLLGSITFTIGTASGGETRTVTWSISQDDKTTLATLVPSILARIDEAMGV